MSFLLDTNIISFHLKRPRGLTGGEARQQRCVACCFAPYRYQMIGIRPLSVADARISESWLTSGRL
jgi:hypothetical protein